jgi:hypothetical protein
MACLDRRQRKEHPTRHLGWDEHFAQIVATTCSDEEALSH